MIWSLKYRPKKLCEYICIKGFANIQFKKDKNNKWKILEINPRFGGGTIFSYLAGINIVKCISSIIEKNIKISDIVSNFKEIIVVRYFEEIIIS